VNPPAGGGRRLRAWLRDPRFLASLLITGLSLAYALRGVDVGQVAAAIAQVDAARLVLPSVPALLLSLWLRALRWRHLTDAVQPISRGALFRAVSVGFMANNLLPLRVGEVLRAWYLARETGASAAALFGTVILERVIDSAVVLGMAALVLGVGGARAAGIDAGTALPVLVGLAMIPAGFVAALRLAPAWIVGLVSRGAGLVLPEALVGRIEEWLRQIAAGLGSVRRGWHLFWIAFHSLGIWMVASVIPFLAAVWALGIDLGSPARALAAAYSTLVWVGAAVALPSAPGFFGPYHAACRAALLPFGVEPELALALGTLSHALFWVTVTATGLAVLRWHRTSLDETLAAADAHKDPAAGRR
jgi:hypothetical protein